MADEWYKPGSRLKLRYFEGDDGTRQFSGWFDSTRSEGCTITRHDDGSTRCLPLGDAAILLGSYYSDQGCSQTLPYLLKGSPAPKYATKSGTVGPRLFTITGLHTATVYTGSPGFCNAVQPGGLASIDLYDVGAEVPSTSFVGATTKTSP